MSPLENRPLRQWWIEGNLAGLMSAGVLLWRGRRDAHAAAGAINAPSHWVWGRKALRRNSVDLRHTLLGLAIHQASSLFWAGAYRWLLGARPAPARVVGGALAVSALAAVVDLKVVPERLTPGFERRLSGPSLSLVYLGFAAGLALGAAAAAPRGRVACRGEATQSGTRGTA